MKLAITDQPGMAGSTTTDSTHVDQIHEALRTYSTVEEISAAVGASNWITDRDGRLVHANHIWLQANGFDSMTAVAGKTASELFDSFVAAREVSESLAVLDTGETKLWTTANEDGDVYRTVRVPIVDGGETVGIVNVRNTFHKTDDPGPAIDATSEIDPLTGAHTLQALHAHLDEILGSETDSSLLLIDIDDFHVVNNSLGRQKADKYLMAAAKRLIKVFGVSLYRISGDGFVVVLPTCDRAQLEAVSEQILQRWHRPIIVEDSEIYGGVSIGIAPIGAQQSHERVLQDAEMALRTSKNGGKNRATIFDKEQQKVANDALANQMMVRRAVTEKEFSLFWHPIFELSTGKISGVEALMRWQPNGGLKTLPAAEFIPFLESSGLIQPVGEQILEQICQQHRSWRTNAKVNRSIPININISRRQFGGGKDFVTHLLTTLHSSGINPSDITLEISDFSSDEDFGKFRDNLFRLHNAGVRLAVDDFGLGLSPVGVISELPIGVIKVGRSLVDRIQPGADDQMLSTIQNGCAQLCRQTVAQGVENQFQLEWLRDQGWTHAQGYFFAKPMDPSEMTNVLAQQ